MPSRGHIGRRANQGSAHPGTLTPDIISHSGPVSMGWREATEDEAVVVERAYAQAAEAAAALVRQPQS